MYNRWYDEKLRRSLAKPFVHIVFGARQTGKSTLINQSLPEDAMRINLADASERTRYLADPSRFTQLCRSLGGKKQPAYVFVDEAQSVPAIFDEVQHLYDGDKKRWRFILCGSSARKLRATGANLLPGRSFLHRLFPLTLSERPANAKRQPQYPLFPLELPWPDDAEPRLFPKAGLEERLAFGDLPGVVTHDEEDRAELLRAYAEVHLEEEMRREAMVKDWPAFLNFLRLAALESGQIVNYQNIAQQIHISQPTVKSHYQLLDDMFIGFWLRPWSGSARRNLLSTPRFLLFDLGVRNAAAGLTPSIDTVRANPGPLFEQWAGLELWKRLNYLKAGELFFLRTHDGAEVDFIVKTPNETIPVEVKWTDKPTTRDARHLRVFMKENPKTCKRGYIICRSPVPQEIEKGIVALPWFCL